MRLILTAILALLYAAAASPGRATSADTDGAVADQILAYYPPDARDAGVAATVTLACKHTPHGALRDCNLISESPTGYFFGLAALNIARASAENPRLNLLPNRANHEEIIVFSFKSSPASIEPNPLESPPDFGPVELSPRQRQTAECLVSSLSSLAEVTDPRLSVSDDPPGHVLFEYRYRHRHTRKIDDSGTFDVTGLLSPDEDRVVLLPGLTTPGTDMNDAYLGIFQIWELWQDRCEVGALEMTGGSQAIFTGLENKTPHPRPLSRDTPLFPPTSVTPERR